MTGLDFFALLVLAVLIVVGIFLALRLGALPGRIAADRGHPQADAIRVLGWIGIITLGVPWLAALVWAYAKPMAGAGLSKRVAALEDEMRRLKGGQGEDAP